MLPVPELDFQRTPVTLIVAAVAVAIEVVCTFDPSRRDVYYSIWKLGLLSTIWSGELWRPFTTSLLHADFLHAAFNVYALLIFGRVLEPLFGPFRYFLLLVVLSFVSMVPSFLVTNFNSALDQQVPIVGLSGIIYGLFGIAWMGRQARRDIGAVCTQELVAMLIAWFFLCIILTYADVMRVANVAHGLGLGVGVLIGQSLFAKTHKRLWQSAAVVVTLLLLVPSFAAPGHPLYEKYVRAQAHNRAVRELRMQMHQLETEARSRNNQSAEEAIPEKKEGNEASSQD